MKKNNIEYPDFEKLDLRVGEIKSAEPIEKSKKLLRLMVDLGEEYGVVQILSGIAEFYIPEDLIGNKYIFVANMAPRAMMGMTSNGMIMAADVEGKAVLLPLSNDLPNGATVR